MAFRTLALARERESLENPSAMEKRVALFPEDLAKVCRSGVKVFVEEDAGAGMDIPDSDYENAGASIQPANMIYENKDIVVKFKGPPLEAISHMRPGSTLFCMAHFRSFPERAKMLENSKINVIAMENILENPRKLHPELLQSRLCMEILTKLWEEEKLFKDPYVYFLGYSPKYVGAIRYLGGYGTKLISIVQKDFSKEEVQNLKHSHKEVVFIYHEDMRGSVSALIDELKRNSYTVYDLAKFEKISTPKIQSYYEAHEKNKLGMRRIECLHETGQAGARYGFTLLREVSLKKLSGKKAQVFVLGYGNVGMGAIHECYLQGVRVTKILNRSCTEASFLNRILPQAHLVINGAEPKPKKYLLSREQTKGLLPKGSVVIDLIGGSVHNRSPVEDIVETTYLTNPYFERNGILFSSLWGWPMMGMMRESNLRYSPQICSVLLEREKLILGLENLKPNLRAALVCGPFYE